MKTFALTLFLVFASLLVSGQTRTEVKYFKDYYTTSEVSADKAKYKEIITYFEDGRKDVIVTNLRTDKTVRSEPYKDGKPTGKWINRSDKGELDAERDFGSLLYSNTKIEDGRYFEVFSDNDPGFTPAHYKTKPDFFIYMMNTIRYPYEARIQNAQGIVYIQAKIDKEGNLIPISIFEGINPFLDFEAFRVLSIMPKWSPSLLNGVPIDTYTIIPVKFQLQG